MDAGNNKKVHPGTLPPLSPIRSAGVHGERSPGPSRGFKAKPLASNDANLASATVSDGAYNGTELDTSHAVGSENALADSKNGATSNKSNHSHSASGSNPSPSARRASALLPFILNMAKGKPDGKTREDESASNVRAENGAPVSGGASNDSLQNDLRNGVEARDENKPVSFHSYMKSHRMVLKGHQKPVLTIAALQLHEMGCQDTLILSGGEDKQLKIWSLKTGELLTTLCGHSQRISAVAVCIILVKETQIVETDGQKVCEGDTERGFTRIPVAITSSWDETLRIWRLDDCVRYCLQLERSQYLEPHHKRQISTNLATNTRKESPIAINDLKTECGNESVLEHKIDRTRSNSERSRRITNSIAENNCSWRSDKHTSSAIVEVSATDIEGSAFVLHGHKNRVYCVTVFHDSTRGQQVAVSGSADNTVRIWSLPTGEALQVLEKKGEITWILSLAACDLSSASNGAMTGSVIATGCKNTIVNVWDLKSAHRYPMRVIKGHTSAVHSMSMFYSMNEAEPLLITLCKDLDVRIWSILDCSLRKILRGNKHFMTSVHVFLVSKNSHPAHPSLPSSIGASASSPSTIAAQSMAVIAASSKSGEIKTWNYSTGEVLRVLNGHPEEATAVTSFVLPNTTSASIGMDAFNSIEDEVFHRKDFSPRDTVRSLEAWQLGMERQVVASAGRDCTLRLWRLSKEKTLKVMHHGDRNKVNCMDIISDGVGESAIVVTGCDDGKLRCWSIGQSDANCVGDAYDHRRVSTLASGRHGLSSGQHVGDGAEFKGTIIWTVRAHTSAILSLCIYIPVPSTTRENATDFEESDSEEEVDKYYANADEAGTSLPSNIVTNSRADGESGTARSSIGDKSDADITRTDRPPHVYPNHLGQVLIITGSRDGYVRISDLSAGDELCPMWQAHLNVIRGLSVCRGIWSEDLRKYIIEPFFVSGAEDNIARVWCLSDYRCKHTLEGHIFDVTCVAHYVHQVQQDTRVERQRVREEMQSSLDLKQLIRAGQQQYESQSRRPSESSTRGGANAGAIAGLKSNVVEGARLNYLQNQRKRNPQPTFDPLILTGSMDSTVIVWNYSRGSIITTLDDHRSNTHITSLAVIRSTSAGPVVAVGDGDGMIKLWSLLPPYHLQQTLTGHIDDVHALDVFINDKLQPMLISGSQDTTLRVWDLQRMRHVRTIEGHKSEINAVRYVHFGGSNDSAIASASSDSTVRVLFDFLGSAPNRDMVEQLFAFDWAGKNNHVFSQDLPDENGKATEKDSLWPRIAHLAAIEGHDEFFGTYSYLFRKALVNGRPDFLSEFLHTSPSALIKTNCGSGSSEYNKVENSRRLRRYSGAAALHKEQMNVFKGKENQYTAGRVTGISGNITDGIADDEEDCRSLLRIAIELADGSAVRTIVSCWCSFMTQVAANKNVANQLSAMPNVHSDQVAMEDLLLLALNYPGEFERFICSVKLVPLGAQKFIPRGAQFMEVDSNKGIKVMHTFRGDNKMTTGTNDITTLLSKLGAASGDAGLFVSEYLHQSPSNFVGSSTRSLYSGEAGSVADGSRPNSGRQLWNSRHLDKARHQQRFFYLPIECAVHMDMLMALTSTCERLESVEIFRSEAGQLILSFAWRAFGRRVHIKTMIIYLLYVFFCNIIDHNVSVHSSAGACRVTGADLFAAWHGAVLCNFWNETILAQLAQYFRQHCMGFYKLHRNHLRSSCKHSAANLLGTGYNHSGDS